MKVCVTGWKPGFQKVSATKTIMAHTLLGLKDSKQCVDDILEGKAVTIEFSTEQAAAEFKRIVEELGAVCISLD